MVDFSHNAILIVDFHGAGKLRERLVSTGKSVAATCQTRWRPNLGPVQEDPRGIY